MSESALKRNRLRTAFDAAVRLWNHTATHSPSRVALTGFAAVTAIVTALLKLDIATQGPGSASFADAFFVATSAVCVTGLTTVDTATFWSPFGQVVIACAIKIGGLGVMTMAGLLILFVSNELNLQQRVLTAKEYRSDRIGEVRQLIIFVLLVSVATELITAAVLFPWFLRNGESPGIAALHALFYGISAYNNAGFVIHPDGLPTSGGAQTPATDWWLTAPIFLAVLMGSLGTAVHMDILRKRPRWWSLHTVLTLWVIALLFILGFVLVIILEWDTPQFSSLPAHGKVLVAAFTSLMPRSGGFAVLPTADMSGATWWLTDGLMFIGGGTGSTAGGIKVTTLAVLVLAAWTESRGDTDIVVKRRTIPMATVRIAVAVMLTAATAIWLGTLILISLTGLSLHNAFFEVTSAFCTVGLSTGVTAGLPDSAKFFLGLLMFLGRFGLITLGTAMSLQTRTRLVRYPEERPSVG